VVCQKDVCATRYSRR